MTGVEAQNDKGWRRRMTMGVEAQNDRWGLGRTVGAWNDSAR